MITSQYKIMLFFINIFCVLLLLYQYTSSGKFPGDLGDTKVVLMMLENFYSSLSNNQESFINFNILYPIKNTAFFSETMWGVAWIYSIFRFIGFNIYEAFNFYFSTVIIINFLVSFYVFQKLKLSIFSSYLGAFIFSCSLPIIAQDVHFHLFFRAAVPLMVLTILYFFETKKTYFLSISITLLIYQFLCSMYLGIFSFVLFLILLVIKTKPRNFVFKHYFVNLYEELRVFFKTQGRTEAIILYIILTLFFLYCLKYISVKFYYDFSRGFPDKGLLIFESFFTTNRSPLIPFIALPKGYPLTEQQAFIGIVPTVIFILGIYFKVYKKTNSFNKNILLSGLILLILFFSIGPFNLYFILYNLPGLDGIRQPSRVILILLFPIALFVGITIDHLILKYSKFIPVLIIFLSWGEIYISKKSIQKIKTEKNLDQNYFRNIPTLNEEDILVFKNVNDGAYNIPLDTSVSLYAAKENIKIMNGFTSFVPKGLGKYEKCQDIKIALKNLENYKNNDLTIKSKSGYWRIIPIGFEETCGNIIFNN